MYVDMYVDMIELMYCMLLVVVGWLGAKDIAPLRHMRQPTCAMGCVEATHNTTYQSWSCAQRILGTWANEVSLEYDDMCRAPAVRPEATHRPNQVCILAHEFL